MTNLDAKRTNNKTAKPNITNNSSDGESYQKPGATQGNLLKTLDSNKQNPS